MRRAEEGRKGDGEGVEKTLEKQKRREREEVKEKNLFVKPKEEK